MMMMTMKMMMARSCLDTTCAASSTICRVESDATLSQFSVSESAVAHFTTVAPSLPPGAREGAFVFTNGHENLVEAQRVTPLRSPLALSSSTRRSE